MATNYQRIFDKNQFYLEDVQGKSKAWFFNEADKFTNQRITPNALLKNNANNSVSKIIPGNMYMYFYDPKHKETLPYYDRFPLVFPFSPTKNGFIGLNMHYLPYQGRIALFTELDKHKSSPYLTEKTKLQLEWNTIVAMSKHKLAEPCVKQYLYSHIKSNIVKVDSYHWVTAMMMPVERFAKQNKMLVWMESKR